MTTDIACSYNFLIFLERIVSSKNLNYTATVKVCKLECLGKVTIIKSEKDDSQSQSFFGVLLRYMNHFQNICQNHPG